ncbi:MAG: SdpI family protein [Candidatus Pacebacteria bacterium]|nr:SdpI family protein [Candidatus Paceibacterota bacterium]
MKKSYLAVIFIILLSFAAGAYFYPQLPDRMASHWNDQGEVDGYMSKFWGAFLLPFILLGVFLLLAIIPKIDPLKGNIEKFRKYFDGFIVLFSLYFLYIYGLTIAWNLGKTFNFTLFMIPSMAVLFYYCGVMIENAKRNWFVGIRTPWTMSSEEVWDKTHRLGGRLFKAAGIIALLGLAFEEYAMAFIMGPVLFAAFYTFLYSYLEYRKIRNISS